MFPEILIHLPAELTLGDNLLVKKFHLLLFFMFMLREVFLDSNFTILIGVNCCFEILAFIDPLEDVLQYLHDGRPYVN
jgi:hypothetical protein